MNGSVYRRLMARASNSCAHFEIAENPAVYNMLTERHLQAMWLEQKYFKPLTAYNGLPIEIISPGVWNAEAGPDFLHAHIRIGQQELRGDIELHLMDEGWYQHGHHADVRYDNVILHIGFWQPPMAKTLLTSKSTPIPCSYLELTVPESKLLKLIDLDLYPHKHFAGSGHCASALFKSLSKEKTAELFQSAALWRLMQKKQRLETRLELPAHFMGGGLAMALGYKQNAEAFLELFIGLKKFAPECDEHSLLAQALGQCGYFAQKYYLKWKTSPFYLALYDNFTKKTLGSYDSPIALIHDKIRPANHPIRRLALLVKFLKDPSIDHLPEQMGHCWNQYWQIARTANKGWMAFRQRLMQLLPTYKDVYWERHYTFEATESKLPIALLGDDLRHEILVNLMLPLIFDEIDQRQNPEEHQAFQTFFSTIPSTKAKKTLYLNHRFFGDTDKQTLLAKADIQQGAYQIHRDFCLNFEASCVGCPFVEKFIELSKHKEERYEQS